MSRRLLAASAFAVLCFGLFAVLKQNPQVFSPIFSPGSASTIPGGDAASGERDPHARAALGVNDESHRESGENESLGDQSGFLAFAHREELNPGAEKFFIVSFRFSLSAFPLRSERRIRLVSKYQYDAAPPFPGWVIAIRPMRTSIRPEVYWQTPAGKGGWYTFDRFDLQINTPYELTLIVKSGEQMSLFLRRLPLAGAAQVAEEPASAAPDGFLGGYSLQGIGVPRSTTQLTFSASANDAAVSRIVLAQVAAVRRSRKNLARIAGDGPDGIKRQLAEGDVVLDYPPAPPEQPEK